MAESGIREQQSDISKDTAHEKIVAHYVNGRVVKGTSHDFSPSRESFLLMPPDEKFEGERIALEDLKGVFFVRDYNGNRYRTERRDFSLCSIKGQKARVDFYDGEEIFGVVQQNLSGLKGFYIYPCDPRSNNKRIFAVTRAVLQVSFLA